MVRRTYKLIPLTIFGILLLSAPILAGVKPGEVITPESAAKVADLLSPGNLLLVKQGMQMKVVPSQRLEWPPPYKTATEKYSPQVKLTADGNLQNYVAGQPFPLLDANDPNVALKVMWNFSFRPLYTDDVDIRDVEVASYAPGKGSGEPVAHFTAGHFAFYNNVGRVEVEPMPTDSEATGAGIRYRFAAYPMLEPAEMRGYGFVRYRHMDPRVEDNSWFYNSKTRHLRRVSADMMSDAAAIIGTGGVATYASNLDPDSFFGFAAKIEDFNYRMLAIKPMLACVHAENSPAKPCPFDGSRTICPENWEMRQLYVIEATEKKPGILAAGMTIPKRIFYIDSEGWFITASDQYDRSGQLWKTIATFNAYRDRPVPDATVAIYPFKRMFQTALVDESVQDGFSTVLFTPGRAPEEHECWYINMGILSKGFFDPSTMERSGH
ncbi:MAG: DUF1329 domain-containing protein [Candidatus Binataceae bacterium]